MAAKMKSILFVRRIRNTAAGVRISSHSHPFIPILRGANKKHTFFKAQFLGVAISSPSKTHSIKRLERERKRVLTACALIIVHLLSYLV
jgi:hypothetical protein